MKKEEIIQEIRNIANNMLNPDEIEGASDTLDLLINLSTPLYALMGRIESEGVTEQPSPWQGKYLVIDETMDGHEINNFAVITASDEQEAIDKYLETHKDDDHGYPWVFNPYIGSGDYDRKQDNEDAAYDDDEEDEED
jgi:hypothetical protein